jgi:O-acetyl-ADP-ribose deacetylase
LPPIGIPVTDISGHGTLGEAHRLRPVRASAARLGRAHANCTPGSGAVDGGDAIIVSVALIEVVLGDIVREQVDAIVTAANESLLGGGGVDWAVHQAAGPRLAEAGAAIAPCDPGDAKATPAFNLDPPVRYIIHTVGPVWDGGAYGEADTLASCYRRCLEVAGDLAVRSIAFPAIATGLYGFPPEYAARIAVGTIRATPTSVERIRLVAFDELTRDLLSAALDR